MDCGARCRSIRTALRRCSATDGGIGARSASACRGWPPDLRSLGANPGDRVAILSQNSDRYLELYLATAWAGAVVVPLNIRWSPVENEDAMRDCRAGMLIVDKTFASVGVGTGESPVRPETDLCRRRRRAGRHGKLRGAAAAERTCSGCDAHRHRPRRHLLHRWHHRPLEGRHAQPRQSHGQFAELARRRPVPELGRSICTPRRCSISPMARRCIRCCSAAAQM